MDIAGNGRGGAAFYWWNFGLMLVSFWKTVTSARRWGVLGVMVVGIWSVAQAQAPKNSPNDYIAQWSDVAIREMVAHRIPASITLAQGILESGNGNSELARVSNNHFGIKCHSDWEGGRTYHDDDAKGECFRVYEDAAESFDDHSQFLKRSRYESLFELDITDYKGWAKGLKRCGYATNPQYANKLIDLVERYELYVYDEQALELMAKGEALAEERNDLTASRLTGGREVLVSENTIQYIIAEPGDTYEALARTLDMMPWQFYSYNEVERKDSDHAVEAGEVVYLQPKRSHGREAWATVQDGESLWDFSQRTGVKMKAILRKNRLNAGEPLVPGTKMALRWRLNQAGETPGWRFWVE